MLHREEIANRKKHWVRAVTACNSKCLFCLDADTPRNVYLEEDVVKADLRRGIEELGADKVIISGGEASLHPLFPEFIRYAKEIGYDRVQTVTNGTQYADKDFYERCVEAGLGEITYSLHGDTPELHDYLTQTPGCFNKLMKALIRSVRDRRMITSVDVVINKQNVGILDKIVELAISVGVTEFDLLHVIPQSNAFRNRDEMFYDVREYLPILQKVFKLNRHPRFYIWTNRFPVSYLEDLEDLIQDPHKMLDEVNGRRFQVRRYLDEGKPLDCREPDRCQHCVIEPFCNTMDNVVEAQRQETWSTFWSMAANLADSAHSPWLHGRSRRAAATGRRVHPHGIGVDSPCRRITAPLGTPRTGDARGLYPRATGRMDRWLRRPRPDRTEPGYGLLDAIPSRHHGGPPLATACSPAHAREDDRCG